MGTCHQKNLAAFHAITVVTLLANLAGLEKKTAWKVFMQHAELLDNLGIGDYTEVTFISCEEFVCLLYMPVETANPITFINELLYVMICSQKVKKRS